MAWRPTRARRLAVFLNSEQDALALDLEAWRERAERVSAACGLAPEDEWSLEFLDDEAVRALNREYRQLDKPTDVLSFAMEEGDDVFPSLPGLPRTLGDVVIAVPTAIRQAEERGHEVDAELALLMIHGLLHLLGEDHDTADRKKQMWRRQQALLDLLGCVVKDFGDVDGAPDAV